jgi:hypothetical protein
VLAHPGQHPGRQAFFAALPCQAAGNLGLHPEFGYQRYGDRVQDGGAFGAQWLAGVQFRWLFWAPVGDVSPTGAWARRGCPAWFLVNLRLGAAGGRPARPPTNLVLIVGLFRMLEQSP